MATIPGQASGGPIPAADLQRDYGFSISSSRPHPGGFEADCWVADETWFIKVWRRRQPPSGLKVLGDLAGAGLPVPVPVPTVAGALHATSGGRPYVVFPYVRGRAASQAEWQLTARALKRVHATQQVELPPFTTAEPEIQQLRVHLGHPWIVDRREEVAASIERLEQVIERTTTKPVRQVVCHRDFGGANLIVEDGEVTAIVDWEQAVRGPREHDLWIAAEGEDCARFLAEYGARDLDADQLEYALLARALRDLAARVLSEVDRPGVETWGFRRIARLDRNLAQFRPFCAEP